MTWKNVLLHLKKYWWARMVQNQNGVIKVSSTSLNLLHGSANQLFHLLTDSAYLQKKKKKKSMYDML